MRLPAAALLALLGAAGALPQDDRIPELIRKLDDDRFEVREQAERDLIRAGEPAVPHLRKAIEESSKSGQGGELRLRAEKALKEIEVQLEARNVYREPKRVTVKAAQEELGTVLEEIGRQTGVRFETGAIDKTARVTLDLKEATLFQALDALCRGQAERTWEHGEEGAVRFLREAHADCPAAYDGPFRIRLVRRRLETSTDFKTQTVTLHLALMVDHEKYLKPARRAELEISRAADDRGNALEVKTGPDPGEGGQQIFVNGRIMVRQGGAWVVRGAAADDAHEVTIKGLGAAATHVSLRGAARVSFPLAPGDVKFDRVVPGEAREAGDYTITIGAVQAGRVSLGFKKTRGKADAGLLADVTQRLPADSLVAVDEEGQEHKAESLMPGAGRSSVVILNGAESHEQSVTQTAMFNTLRGRTIKEIRFKFSHRAYVRAVPFEIPDLPLR